MTDKFDKLRDAFIKSGYPENSLVLRTALIKQVTDEIDRRDFSLITVIGPSRTGKTQLIKYVELQFKERVMLHLDGGIIRSQESLIEKLEFEIRKPDFQSKLKELMKIFSLEINLPGLTIKLNETNDAPALEKVSSTLKELGKIGCILVIDDFHKLPDDTMQLLLNYLKSLTDRSNEYAGLKIILIYVPTRHIRNSHTFRELGMRATFVAVTLWGADELKSIASDSLRKLDYGAIGLEQLAKQCFGLPALMQLCCREHVSTNMKPEHAVFDISKRKSKKIMETVASELWNGYCRAIYSDLVAKRVQVTHELFLLQEDRIQATINEMIWFSISQMELDIAQQHEISLDISDLHTYMIDNKITYLLSKKIIDIDIVSRAVENMARILEKKYKESTIREKSDPVFELHDDRILIYSSDFLFTLRHSQEYLRQLKRPRRW